MKKALLLFITCCIACSLQAQIYVPKKLKGKAGKYLMDMMYVPQDTLYHRLRQCFGLSLKLSAKSVVGQFYLCEYETTNKDWLGFVHAMESKYGKMGAYKFLPDTNSWFNVIQPYYDRALDWDWYLRHPAFANYPVVGVTWLQVQDFIAWKNTQIDSLLKAQGITNYKVIFRLPTSNEFELVSQHKYNPQWGLLSVKGGYLANFGVIKDSTGYVFKSKENDGYETTGPVDAYYPNNLGIYNIKGNVEEWVSDEYKGYPRSTSYDKWLNIDTTAVDTAVHICRGGSWFDGPYYLYPTVTKAYPPNACSAFTGFRLAMDVVEVKPAAGR